MTRDSRIGMMGFVIAWLAIGPHAPAQMPITRGKADRAEEIDEGIIRDQNVQKLAAPRVPAPPPANQVKVFVGGANGQKFLTFEQPADPHADVADDLDGPPEERPAQQPAMIFNLQDAVIGRENFDRWVFGDGVGEVARRDRLNSLIWRKVDAVSRKRALTAAEESKLRLAALGDIKRFFDRVEDRRRKFEAARTQFNTGMAFLNSIEPLGKEFEDGPFGEGSLFAKTLRKIENDARAARPAGD